ncbi:CD40 ligand [Syngnathus typhle]|uniref:CD40 ligand n=1 Tax=Syngnathus typhle TaxID=161592 RepID=UPI002A6A756F|nr:CD40 ligand [Syngnathus typhle]
MINTYHSSMASLPPPLPPRRSQVLVEPQASSARRSKTLLRSLLGVVVLHFLLTSGGFIFLYYTNKTETTPQLSGDAPQHSSRTLARMIVAKPKDLSALESRSGNLQWDMKHSVRNNINYYHNSWLTALQPGDYVVFSRVTFSKADPVKPLASAVKLRRGESAKETVAMVAYCSLDTSGSGSNPQLCTASMGEVMSLERGNQLSLWVEDRSLVDYSRAATSFGMYKL